MLSGASRSLRRVCSTLAGRAAGAGDGVQGTLRIAGAVRGPSPSERPAGDTSRKYVSVDHLGLEDVPVRLQAGEHVHQIRFGLLHHAEQGLRHALT